MPIHRPHPLTAALLSVVLLASSAGALAQTAQDRAQERRERHSQKSDGNAEPAAEAAASEALFPNATRKSPSTKASAKLSPKLQELVDAYNADDAAKGLPIADALIANDAANTYDHAFAAQLAAQFAYSKGDTAAAKAYITKAIAYDGLDNNAHYQSIAMLSQLQMQDQDYAAALATDERLLSETKSTNPDYLVLKGNALYRLKRYPEAVDALKQAIAASPNPKPEWQQLLMGAYVEMGKPAEAAKLAEGLASTNPGDKQAQRNLAVMYMQTDQNDKAIATLEKLRASGELTDESDYRNLYALYLGGQGKEKEAITVINDGLAKGVLKQDFKNNVALAQAYYFSDQMGPAIEAYKKAAPLAPDGETYLNLAKALYTEGKVGEAKQAAQQALDKGVKNPAEAKKILDRKG